MNVIEVRQGTDAWHSLRAECDTASEAPAMMGVSKYLSRAELMRQKHTGLAPVVDSAKQALFDAGHAAEASARLIAEEEIGAELFPVVATLEVDGLKLLASLDGATLMEDVIFEHKLWNEDLAQAVRAGELPAHYTAQMDQQLLVSGAERCLFMTSDGTRERMAWCWYESSPEKFAAVIAGWKQFRLDLASYAPPSVVDPVPAGRAPQTLPALRIEVAGQVTASNLGAFRETALAAIRGVRRELSTDQDFADAEASVKWCAEVESRLEAAKQHALSQTASIDELFRAIDDIAAEARRTRLDLDRLVKARKEAIREEIVLEAKRALMAHLETLNREIHPAKLNATAAGLGDFAAAIKGKRTVQTLRDACDTELARSRIALDEQARGIRANLSAFRQLALDVDRGFLFPDLGALAHKAADDFAAAVRQRIADHDAEVARKAAAAEAKRAAEEAAAAARAQAQAQAQTTNTEGQHPQQVLKATPVTADATDRGTAANESPRGGAMGAGQPTAVGPAGGIAEPATLKLGDICAMFGPGFSMTAAFVADTLGVPHSATDKAAKLYRPSDVRRICNALQALTAQVAAGDRLAA